MKTIYLKIKYTFNKNWVLGENPFNHIRGRFGYTLRKFSCFQRNSSCEKCLGKGRCPYSVIFNTINIDKTGKLKKLQMIPSPYYLTSDFSKLHFEVKKGKKLKMYLTIFGTGINYLLYFNQVLNNLFIQNSGEVIAKCSEISFKDFKKNKWQKLKTTNIDYCEIKIGDINLDYNLLDKKNNSKILNFDINSPIHIKSKGKYISNLSFSNIAKSLVRRYSNLEFCYGDNEFEDVNFSEIFNNSNLFTDVTRELKVVKLKRKSNDINRTMTLIGSMGEFSVIPQSRFWIDFIKRVSIIGVGKYTSFGFGNIKVKSVLNKKKGDKNVG